MTPWKWHWNMLKRSGETGDKLISCFRLCRLEVGTERWWCVFPPKKTISPLKPPPQKKVKVYILRSSSPLGFPFISCVCFPPQKPTKKTTSGESTGSHAFDAHYHTSISVARLSAFLKRLNKKNTVTSRRFGGSCPAVFGWPMIFRRLELDLSTKKKGGSQRP